MAIVAPLPLLHSIVDWLRAGYPDGVPGADRVPLLALLRATPLTEDEIKQVVRNLTATDSPAMADGIIDRDEIAAFIEDFAHHDAGPGKHPPSRREARHRRLATCRGERQLGRRPRSTARSSRRR